MYYINKLVGFCLSPLGVAFIGVALGMTLRHVKLRGKTFRKTGAFIIALALVELWVFSCSVTTRFIGVPLEADEANNVKGEEGGAIVLLGGGMGVHEECGRSEIFGGADRAWMAAKLWKAGRAPIITVSGGGAKGEIEFLGDMGVDTNKVVMLEEARNTEEEAKLIAGAINSVGGKAKILLVTSAWHMPRAKMLFERAGFEVVAAPTDYEMHYVAEAPIRFVDFVPNAEALVRNSYAVKEWVARFCYALKR